MNVSLGVLFGLLSMIGYGIGNAIAKVPAKEVGSRKTLFFRNVIISVIFSIVVLFFRSEINFSMRYVLIAFGISFIGYIPAVTLLEGLKRGDVGVIGPVANSSVIFTILFAVIFFNERLSVMQSFSVVLIILGIILISTDFRNFKRSHLFSISSGVPFALITCFLWGIVFFLIKIPVNVLGPILSSFILEFGIMIYSGLHLRIAKKGFEISKRALYYILFVAIGGAMGTLFYSMGISTADVSIVSAISASNPLVTAVYGRIAYKERLRMQQYFSILMIVLGIVMISAV